MRCLSKADVGENAARRKTEGSVALLRLPRGSCGDSSRQHSPMFDVSFLCRRRALLLLGLSAFIVPAVWAERETSDSSDALQFFPDLALGRSGLSGTVFEKVGLEADIDPELY